MSGAEKLEPAKETNRAQQALAITGKVSAQADSILELHQMESLPTMLPSEPLGGFDSRKWNRPCQPATEQQPHPVVQCERHPPGADVSMQHYLPCRSLCLSMCLAIYPACVPECLLTSSSLSLHRNLVFHVLHLLSRTISRSTTDSNSGNTDRRHCRGDF